MRVFVAILCIGCVGCKGGGGGLMGEPVTLSDAPPPTVPADWTLVSLDVGFSMAFPPGWDGGVADRAQIEDFVKRRNENAWDVLERRKADVNLDTTKALIAERHEFEVLDTMQTKGTDQALHALREDTGRKLSLEEAVARWKDTIYGGSNPPEMKEEDVELPVGKAKVLWYAQSSMGFIEKVTVYFLVDGTVQYTFFWGENAHGGADPIPVKEIMETFRPVRG